ncbi:MAG TPA: hypothetical protein PLZ93_10640 [Nocardioides sp.]|uniref:hypothetical protein n=1 Tax=uncultured Nocardioides sp. TaxID=198441 RepID=UPI0026096AD2|nr:hypothetical protein [uncultured Nocardioides sp.]HRD60873.1 hypothetical protein [Nocardioides sp.]HRI96063.1 hypothetical protein [Nocardioides sp.]HRK46722.1 hypothetical protein [Nocardioides sp.]
MRSQRMVLEVARDAAHATLFGVLCVLDGVRDIDDPPHSELILTAVNADGIRRLNPMEEALHDLLNATVHPPSEPAPK